MTDSIQNELKKISLFADLPDEMIAQLATKVEEKTLPTGTVLFNEGEDGDSLYILLNGAIEIYHPSSGTVLDRLSDGDYFGEMALVEDKPRSASARATTETNLLQLCRPDYNELLEKNPQLAMKMANVISARLRVFMGADQPEEVKEKKGSTTKVFISYSRKDKEFVQKFHKAISTFGIDTWVDWDNIPLTADWWSEIQLGIENADAFAFVISPDSLMSEVCAREVQTAVDHHKRLIPILHREPEQGNPMHEKISSHNWIYMRNDAELEANVPQMLEVVNLDLDFVRTHTRLLERALAWERAKKNPSFLLQGDELQAAENWLQSAGEKQPPPTALHIEFIQASRQAANKRQRVVLTASLVGLALALVLAVVSFVFFLQARQAQADAEVARDNALAAEAYANNQASIAATAKAEAEISRDEALVAQATALAAEEIAKQQADIALTAKAEAEAQRVIAEDQAKLAKAGQLAASGQALLEINPPLAALLALESDRLSPNNQTAQEVLSLLPVYFPPLDQTFIDPNVNYVSRIAWSETGQIASLSGNSVILWSMETSEPEQVLYGHEANITALDWGPTGRLVTGAEDGTIIVWNLQTGEPDIRLPVIQTQGISSLAWNSRGRLASSSWDGSIVVQDLSGQNTETVFLQYEFGINAVAWSPFGALAAGADDGTVSIWNVQTEELDISYRDHQAGVLTVAYSPEGYLASGSRDSTVAVRRPSGNLETILRGHIDYVNVVAWSNDERLASASWDSTVILWDLEKGEAQRVFRGHTGSVSGLDWGPDGRLASGSEFLFIWDPDAAASLTSYPGHLDWINSVVWTPDGQLVSAGGDGKLHFWDVETQTIDRSYASGWGALDVSSNNRVLSGQIILDRNTGQEYFINGDRLVFSPDGNFLAGKTYGNWNEFGVWALQPLFESGDAVSTTITLEGDVGIQLVTWSPDGGTLVTGNDDGSITLWDFNPGILSTTEQQTLPGHEGAVVALAWSMDGRLASSGEDNQIFIWNLRTQTIENVLVGILESPASTLSWNSDGDLASITGSDTRILVWDVAQEKVKVILGSPYRGQITTMAWSPDGTQLAFGGQSYNVYVYNALYVQSPCNWLTRNMTYWEWSTYLPGEPYQPTCPDLPVGTAYEDEKTAAAGPLVEEGIQAAFDGDIATSAELLQEAEAQGLEVDPWAWFYLCLWGSLYDQAEHSIFACDRAIELIPEVADLYQYRGISLALLGDFEGAIEDLEFFLESAAEYGYPEEMISRAESWLDDLQAGNNPFDEETLALLRDENN